MGNVEFDNQANTGFTSRQILGEQVVPGMTKMLVRTGIVSDPRKAEYILIGTVILCLCLAGVLLYKTYKTENAGVLPSNPSPEEVRQLMYDPKNFFKSHAK